METTNLRSSVAAALDEAGIPYACEDANSQPLRIEVMGYRMAIAFDPRDDSFVQVGLGLGYPVDPLKERAYLRAVHDLAATMKAVKVSVDGSGFALTVEQFWTPDAVRIGLSRSISVLLSAARDLADRVEAIKAAGASARFISAMESEVAQRRNAG